MKVVKVGENWPGGISDGLELNCSECDKNTNWVFKVTEELWNNVVPNRGLQDVVCLNCFDKLAKEKGYKLSDGLLEVQFTGIGETVKLNPEIAYDYETGR